MTDYAFTIDTALSWEGTFPAPNPHCWEVEIHSPLGDYPVVLVSDRYMRSDATEAPMLALNAWEERESDALPPFVDRVWLRVRRHGDDWSEPVNWRRDDHGDWAPPTPDSLACDALGRPHPRSGTADWVALVWRIAGDDDDGTFVVDDEDGENLSVIRRIIDDDENEYRELATGPAAAILARVAAGEWA